MPSNHRSHRDEQLRRTIAVEAARIMVDQGVDDFLLAKRKAADRFGVRNQSVLPNNAEIQAAVIEHQRLFQAESHAQQLADQRMCSLRLMRLLAPFNPHLAGAVLSGAATAHSDLELHVFTDRATDISTRLLELGIAHGHAEHRFRHDAERQLSYPSFKFMAGEQAVEVIVFPVTGIRQAPHSPVDGKPMQRADISTVEQLLRNR